MSLTPAIFSPIGHFREPLRKILSQPTRAVEHVGVERPEIVEYV
ncbi:MAG: hypothetical protein WCJ35_14850 [Planctomycetota bacterium]